MKNILLVKNLNSEESAKRIDAALAETRVDYEVNIEKQCVVVMGNSDMVAVARKVINDLGFIKGKCCLFFLCYKRLDMSKVIKNRFAY